MRRECCKQTAPGDTLIDFFSDTGSIPVISTRLDIARTPALPRGCGCDVRTKPEGQGTKYLAPRACLLKPCFGGRVAGRASLPLAGEGAPQSGADEVEAFPSRRAFRLHQQPGLRGSAVCGICTIGKHNVVQNTHTRWETCNFYAAPCKMQGKKYMDNVKKNQL